MLSHSNVQAVVATGEVDPIVLREQIVDEVAPHVQPTGTVDAVFGLRSWTATLG